MTSPGYLLGIPVNAGKGLLGILLAFSLFPLNAYSETTFCPIYPIGIASEILGDASPSTAFTELPIATGAGNFGWLSWDGSPSAPTLANSLVPPGDSDAYVNPNDPDDRIPEIGDWVTGSPGVTGSRLVKQNLSALLGEDIIVPVWSETVGAGNNLNYKIENFVVISLSGYKLNGQGWISFQLKGDARCYNDPPVVQDKTVSTPEDTPVDFVLSHQDPEADPVEYSVVAHPEHGTLSGEYPDLTYTPAKDFNGQDGFSFQVDDGQFASNVGTVSIEVTPVNDAPLAFGEQFVIDEDQVLELTLRAQDIEGDALGYRVVSGPANGAVQLDGADVVYTPESNFNGTDEFGFVANDGELDSNVATISITSNPVNDAPVAIAAHYEVYNNASRSIVLEGSDVDGDSLTFAIVDSPQAGSITGSLPHIEYTPNPGYVGQDQFTFTVNDGVLGSLPALVALDVREPNKPPIITSDAVTSAVQSQPYVYDVEATDPNLDDVLDYSLTENPQGMTIDPVDGSINWVPGDTYLAGSSEANKYCAVPIFNEIPRAADVVVAIDRSGSMTGETAWIKDLIPSLNTSLEQNDVGVTGDPNQYGLVSYLASPTVHQIGGDLMGSAEAFVAAASIAIGGGTEDGYRAIDYVLNNYPLREGAATNIILVTDEDRDNTNSAITFNSLRDKLQGENALLNVVVNNRFHCGDGTRALGIDAMGNGYLVDGQGGFLTCSNARIGSGAGSTERDYVDLALSLDGAAWDLNFLRQGGLFAESFSKALVQIKVREVINQLSVTQSDLVVSGLEVVAGETTRTIQVTVTNRGLADQAEDSTLYLFNGSESGPQLGQAPVSGIEAGSSQLFSFDVPADTRIAEITAKVTALSEQLECIRTNNGVSMPLVGVRVTDTGGLSDEQEYVLWVSEANSPPEIISTPVESVVAGEDYFYQVVGRDENIGDLYRFSLTERPQGMIINNQTGELTWLPGDEQSGEHNIVIRAQDLSGAYTEQAYTLLVSPANQRPVMTSTPPTTATAGEVYSYDVDATDPDGDTLSFQLSDHPGGMAIDTQSGQISWSPSLEQVGGQVVVVRVVDDKGAVITQSFIIQVQEPAGGGVEPNQPPVIDSSPVTSIESGENYQYQVIASDPDADPLGYRLLQYPDGMSIDGTGLIDWETPEGVAGKVTVVIEVVDPDGLTARQQYSLEVIVSTLNSPPRIESTPGTSAQLNEQYTYAIVASDIDGDPLTYSLVNGPGGMQLTNNQALEWTPVSEGNHPVEINVADNRGGSATQSFSVAVGGQGNLPPGISSEPASVANVGEVYSYSVIASDPEGGALTYELVSSPQGMSLSAGGEISWTPTVEQLGVRGVSVRVSDDAGGSATQIFEIQVSDATNEPPVIESVAPSSVTLPDTYGYQLVAIDPDGDVLQYSLVDAPDGMTIDAQGNIDWAVAVSDAGQHPVVAEVADGRGGTSRQSFSVLVIDPNNHAPVITSEAVQAATVAELYQYQVQASDGDGDPLTYSLEFGPTGMTMDSAGLVSWTPGSDQVTVHDVRVVVSDGRGGQGTQTYSITVGDGTSNTLPSIVSTPPQSTKVGMTYQYQVTAEDPDGDNLVFDLLSGPPSATIDADTGLLQWSPANSGSVEFRVSVSDGSGYVTQTWNLRVLQASAELGAGIVVVSSTPTVGETVTIRVVADDYVGQLTVSATIDGTPLTLDGNHEARVSYSSAGSHLVEATVSDDLDTVTDSREFFVSDGSDTTVPVVSIENPANQVEVTAPLDIVGSIEDDNLAYWKLLLKGVDREAFTVIAEGTQTAVSETLANFDPSLYTNGLYDLVLQAVDYGGNIGVDKTVMRLTGNLKVGNFSFTVTDLEIPVSGIPIRINRTYDSRRRGESLDFGHGWSIDYRDIKVEESRAPGSDWVLNSYSSGFKGAFTTFCVEPLGDPLVTVTLPTGEVETFRAVAFPECNLYQPVIDVQLEFEPVDGTLSTLRQTNYSSLRLYNGNLMEPDVLQPADPARYALTTRSGYVYELDQNFGIERIVDPNGNTLTYTDNGVIHSDGKSVLFERDGNGKITAIIDPAGNRLDYTRDDEGDLVAARDQVGAETTYTYNNDHGLVDMVDPLGRPILKNIYDDDGRLIAQEDGEGNRTEFNHDIAGRLSLVTDRNGNTTALYYDDEGNVTTRVDALGNTTTYTYDADGNQLTETNPLGQATSATFDDRRNQLTWTDALGNTLSYEYNTRGQEIRITDARGNVYQNTYDGVGNLVSIVAPNGDIAGNQINAKGLVTRTTDLEGNTTEFTYDSEGNKLTETDAEGNTSTFGYDTNGNLVTETVNRTRVDGTVLSETTRYTYDAKNRLTSTTDRNGNTTYTEYDLAGNEVATVDALGRRTEMDYDAYGRLIETRYPDGTTETRTYDPEGNLLSDTNRAGRTTVYEYDALNRQVKVIHPDGSFNQTEYDAADRVSAEIDENGNRTSYEYDAAGRRTATVDAQGNRHTFEYDADGNLTAEVDAKGNRTEYAYNSLDQRIRTTYHNASTTEQGFDALGRNTANTDQAGITTTYTYDGLGRLTTVTDALGNTTSYTYDEAGNKLTQTDAEGRTTNWEYDALGRVIARTLPLGQRETLEYDAAGNLIRHTDFNGQLTVHLYDESNRKEATQYQDGTIESWTYTPTGQIATATEEQPDGSLRTWTYQYDARDRLVLETKPDGDRLAYQYDSAGNKTRVTVTQDDGATHTTSYSYDSLNRLQAVTDHNNQVTSYGYDAVGNLSSVSHPNGASDVYHYDALNRLTRKETFNGSGALVQSFDYTLHPTGRRTAISEQDGRFTQYAYDDLYRLTGEQITDPVNGNHGASYQYDAVGNRLVETAKGVQTAYSYDANDRLQQRGGTTYTYDANGNTLTETENGITAAYSYNAKNQLQAHTREGVTTVYDYNLNDIRIGQSDGSSTTTYLVDANRNYAQVLVEESDADETLYTYGHDLLSQERAGASHYFHYDGLGSTRALTDQAGVISDYYDYEAFGTLLNRTGDTENHYLFTGEQYDSGLDQYYLRARYYDQGIGRFTQMDTWMGVNTDPITLHKYLYGNADPANMIDPSGQFSLGSVSAANDIASTLVTMQIDAGLSLLDAGFGVYAVDDGNIDKIRAATQVLGIAALGASGIKLAKLLSKKFRKGPITDITFGPHTTPGPLPDLVANTFRSSTYTQKVLKEPLVLYRVHGGRAGQLRSFWSRNRPCGPVQNAMDCALLDEFGNTQEFISTIRVPKDTIIYEGIAGPQRNGVQTLLGGGNQVYIEMVDPSWLIR